jgi:signal transduction histidine kinase/ActR/RegA family two-component response regulator
MHDVRGLMSRVDWSSSLLGPREKWPPTFRNALSICLGSRFPTAVLWGPEFVLFYNDAYQQILGKKQRAFGRPCFEVWGELRSILEPIFEDTFATGAAAWAEKQLLPVERNGYIEEAFFTYSLSAIEEDDGAIAGLLATVSETTKQVIGDRRLRILSSLAEELSQARCLADTCERAVRMIARHPHDVPLSLVYLFDEDETRARLYHSLRADLIAAREVIEATDATTAAWPLFDLLDGGRPFVVLEDVRRRFGDLPSVVWPEPVEKAVLVRIPRPNHGRPYGVLVVGVSPRRALDDDYLAFFRLIASHLGNAFANAIAHEQERARARALGELDRAKTDFFSNVSHEFRTPLTLMLAPVADLLADEGKTLSTMQREQLELVQRSSQRLLKLVNTLLQFSRIEAGRADASFESTDLSSLTTDLASIFRSTIEKAGLRLELAMSDLGEEVFVDHDMWAKIVLNLISNAFKHTFDGGITVSLARKGDGVELVVSDTGIGIPASELRNIFTRFHRVPRARSRSHEGSGIGLSLAEQLVRLHGGTIDVKSEEGRGSSFIVRLPLGRAHLPSNSVAPRLPSTHVALSAYASEAGRWLPDASEGVAPPTEENGVEDRFAAGAIEPDHGGDATDPAREPDAHVLVVDDNADIRDYMKRLLGEKWRVSTAVDGREALNIALHERIDVVLADVMMPRLDGIGLVRALRAATATRTLPIILVSARAGEDASAEGLETGADDYLIKPFHSRELIARVRTHIALGRARREAERTHVFFEHVPWLRW